MKKTKPEVEAEIAALEALKFTGRFKTKMEDLRDLQVDVLKAGLDTTTEEWEILGDEAKDASYEAENWKNGSSTAQPSKGYDGFTA